MRKPESGLIINYKFWVGESVTRAASCAYIITKQLPECGGEFKYRMKSGSELRERVARELAGIGLRGVN